MLQTIGLEISARVFVGPLFADDWHFLGRCMRRHIITSTPTLVGRCSNDFSDSQLYRVYLYINLLIILKPFLIEKGSSPTQFKGADLNLFCIYESTIENTIRKMTCYRFHSFRFEFDIFKCSRCFRKCSRCFRLRTLTRSNTLLIEIYFRLLSAISLSWRCVLSPFRTRYSVSSVKWVLNLDAATGSYKSNCWANFSDNLTTVGRSTMSVHRANARLSLLTSTSPYKSTQTHITNINSHSTASISTTKWSYKSSQNHALRV